jgi:hypothetical protein
VEAFFGRQIEICFRNTTKSQQIFIKEKLHKFFFWIIGKLDREDPFFQGNFLNNKLFVMFKVYIASFNQITRYLLIFGRKFKKWYFFNSLAIHRGTIRRAQFTDVKMHCGTIHREKIKIPLD